MVSLNKVLFWEIGLNLKWLQILSDVVLRKYCVRRVIFVFKWNPRYWQDIRNLCGWVHVVIFMSKEIKWIPI